jgi:integrase
MQSRRGVIESAAAALAFYMKANAGRSPTGPTYRTERNSPKWRTYGRTTISTGSYGQVQRALYLAAVMTGMRQGELLALRWQDVDWGAQRVRVNRNYVRGAFGTPKSHRGRSIPLADRLGGELDMLHRASAFQDDDDLVFANSHTGRPFNGHTLTRTFQTALENGNVRKVRFHDLRHTFGTRMAAAGVPMRTLQEWMGHRDFRTTLIYADYAPGAHEVELVNGAFAEPQTDSPSVPYRSAA